MWPLRLDFKPVKVQSPETQMTYYNGWEQPQRAALHHFSMMQQPSQCCSDYISKGVAKRALIVFPIKAQLK
jgi:hypothetical protein